jgi:hypothetical protein
VSDRVQVMTVAKLRLPDDFEEYGWEVEAKGWFDGAVVEFDGRLAPISFYDSTRLAEEIGEELAVSGCVAFRNLVVVAAVTPSMMQQAIDRLVATGEVERFISP